MSLAAQQLPTQTQTVTVIKHDDAPNARFQAVVYGAGEQATQPIHTTSTQGAMVCWLVCNGYKWVPDSQPSLWTKG